MGRDLFDDRLDAVDEDDDFDEYDDYGWSDIELPEEEHWSEMDYETSKRAVILARLRQYPRARFVLGALILTGGIATTAVLFQPHHAAESDAQRMGTIQTTVPAPPDLNDWVPTPELLPAQPADTPTGAAGIADQSNPVPTTMTVVPPLPDTNSDDLVHVTNELFRFKYWLDQHPNMSELNQLYAPGSSALAHFSQDMQALISQGAVGSQPQANVLNVAVVSQTASTATIDAKTQYGSPQVLMETLHLVRGTDNRWRISDWVVINA